MFQTVVMYVWMGASMYECKNVCMFLRLHDIRSLLQTGRDVCRTYPMMEGSKGGMGGKGGKGGKRGKGGKGG